MFARWNADACAGCYPAAALHAHSKLSASQHHACVNTPRKECSVGQALRHTRCARQRLHSPAVYSSARAASCGEHAVLVRSNQGASTISFSFARACALAANTTRSTVPQKVHCRKRFGQAIGSRRETRGHALGSLSSSSAAGILGQKRCEQMSTEARARRGCRGRIAALEPAAADCRLCKCRRLCCSSTACLSAGEAVLLAYSRVTRSRTARCPSFVTKLPAVLPHLVSPTKPASSIPQGRIMIQSHDSLAKAAVRHHDDTTQTRALACPGAW